MEYFMPTRLYTGADCLAAHADALAALGTSCLIVTDKTSARSSGALADVSSALGQAHVASAVWDSITANPPLASCMEAGRFARNLRCDFILGIGGGSALDAAKAIAVLAANPDLTEEAFYAKQWAAEPLPIALVGTTAGTGSEVTKVSVLTDSASRKHSIHDDRLYARVSFGDPRHTSTCPQPVTLTCGVDVLAHATEAYFSRKADEISRAFSVRAVRLAWEPLKAVARGEQLSAVQRGALYDASILGGLAINTCGTCFPHNVGYYLTENYGVPHGFASAVFLPKMVEMCHREDLAYADGFFAAIGHSLDSFVQLVRACLPEFTFKMDADEIEVALPRWENNGSVKNTRADVSTTDIREILTDMFV